MENVPSLAYRSLHLSDADRGIGEVVTVRTDLPAALDARVPTDDFSTTDLLMLLTTSATPDGPDVIVPAGTRLVVRGRRSFEHHLASAVDVTVTAVLLAEEGIDDERADAEFTRAMLMLSLALASGPSGRGADAPRFGGPVSAGA